MEKVALAEVIIYGTSWCGDCYRTRKLLDHFQIAYSWVNIDVDKEGEQLVLRINHGIRSVPTIIFEDGSLLVEPSNEALMKKIGLPDIG